MISKETNFKDRNPINFLLERSLGLFSDSLISMVLFGSYARKNYSKNSDLDLIVVLENNKNYNFSKLRRDFLLEFEKKLDLHIFSKAEVIQNFNDFSPIFVTLLLGKRILFDKDMFFKKQFENFIRQMLKIEIKYCEGDKIWEMKKIAINLEASH